MRCKGLRKLLLAMALAAVLFILFGAVGALGVDKWADFDIEKITGCGRSSIVYDLEGVEVMRLHGSEDRVWISIDDIPEHVQLAFISAEDARFFEHEGIDLIRIAGAIVADIKAGGYVQGASTISQQLIKLSHLNSQKTISRKAEEAVLAYQMERSCSKEEILEMYLNYVYFGGGYYGIEAAANGYFGVSAGELTIGQSAMLAGILKSPSNYAPHLDYEASMDRRNLVLSLMAQYGHINEGERIAAVSERPEIVRGAEDEYSGYYTDAVIKTASGLLGITVEELLSGGYHIYSAMDTGLQLYCEELFGREDLFPTQDCQGAMVVQQPGTGLVTAMVGGRGYQGGMAFNRATDIRRQPGSVIKPVISYAPAMEYLGYTAATMVLDQETSFGDYAPANFNDKYYGWVTVREAVTRSLNVPAVKILSEVGVDRAKAFASMCGLEFHEDDDSLALALGGFTYGVSPLQVAGAYSCFASGGVYNPPSVVRRILDGEGHTLYEYQPKGLRVMSEANAYILTSMMKSVVSEGTGHRLNSLNIPIAGKTGTVGAGSGNRDAWMATYTPDCTAVVWMGYDSDDLGALPSGATGGSYPALLLGELYAAMYPGGMDEDFPMPADVAEYRIDQRTLELTHKLTLANAMTPKSSQMTELFTSSTAPDETTSYWSVPGAAQNLRISVQGGGLIVSFDCRDSFGEYLLYRKGASGGETLLGSWDGATGHVEFTDHSAQPGETYQYRVLCRHKELRIGDRYVYGPSTSYAPAQAPSRALSIILENSY